MHLYNTYLYINSAYMIQYGTYLLKIGVDCGTINAYIPMQIKKH